MFDLTEYSDEELRELLAVERDAVEFFTSIGDYEQADKDEALLSDVRAEIDRRVRP